MTGAVTAETCRLVVGGPDRQIEVAVPASVLVADLLPALLHHLGDGLADTGLTHGGWVLQRAGQAPLDEESTVAALGLHDGEVVYLRPRAEQLPEVDFDDLVDGMATGVSSRSGKWRPAMTRWAAQGAVGLLTALGMFAPALPGPVGPRAVAAFAVAAFALIAGIALGRAVREDGFAVLLGAAAVGFAGVGGALLPGGSGRLEPLHLSGPQLLAGAATGAAVAVLATLLLGAASRFFLAVTTALLLAALGGGGAAVGGLTGGQAAAVVAVVATALVPVVPMLAFRLAGLRLAPLPTKPEHLQEELDPEPAAPLLERAAAVDRFMTALHAGLGAATTIAVPVMATHAGWAQLTLLALLALVLLLSARPMTSAWHRLTQAVPAAAGLAAAVGGLLAAAASPVRLAALLLLAPAVWALIGFARSMGTRRLMPYWGRIGDIVLTVAAVALLPILLAVLDLYRVFRAIGG